MGTNINAVVSNSIKDKLGIIRGELVETLLNNVVAIQVLDEFDNLVAESVDDDLNLLRSGDELDHLLQRSGSVLVQSNTDQF